MSGTSVTNREVASTEDAPRHPVRERGRAGHAIAAVSVIGLVQVCLVLVFAWAASRSAPHDLPIVVAGPTQAVQGVEQGLAQGDPGAFDVSVVADEAAARNAVLDRDAYAAIVLAPAGATLYTASAAAPAVAQSLAQSVPEALGAAQPGAEVTVTDLAPNPADDPHGAALPTALIPITITSIVAGAAVVRLARSRGVRLLALGAYAVVTGLLAALALQTMLGAVTGSWVANASVLALVALAIAAGTAGLAAVGGIPGVVVAALVFFFLGFPFSGAMTAWQLVPTPWGMLAQYLPVGAANTAVRSVAFFDGAASGPALGVLATWSAAGLALTGLLRGRMAPAPTAAQT